MSFRFFNYKSTYASQIRDFFITLKIILNKNIPKKFKIAKKPPQLV